MARIEDLQVEPRDVVADFAPEALSAASQGVSLAEDAARLHSNRMTMHGHGAQGPTIDSDGSDDTCAPLAGPARRGSFVPCLSLGPGRCRRRCVRPDFSSCGHDARHLDRAGRARVPAGHGGSDGARSHGGIVPCTRHRGTTGLACGRRAAAVVPLGPFGPAPFSLRHGWACAIRARPPWCD